MVDTQTFRKYIRELQSNIMRGDATEHTHRPALKTLLESVRDGIVATNEPTRIECGAPDYSISRNALIVGYIEAKDIGMSLDAIERDSQLKRYRDNIHNLILANYTEFRWFVDSRKRLTAKLADDDGSGSLTTSGDSIADTADLLSAFFEQSPETVSRPEELAERMAKPTRMIANIVQQAFSGNQASQDVSELYDATKQTLIADLSIDDFADMFAKTLAYGLFAARVNSGTDGFHWSTAARHTCRQSVSRTGIQCHIGA